MNNLLLCAYNAISMLMSYMCEYQHRIVTLIVLVICCTNVVFNVGLILIIDNSDVIQLFIACVMDIFLDVCNPPTIPDDVAVTFANVVDINIFVVMEKGQIGVTPIPTKRETQVGL